MTDIKDFRIVYMGTPEFAVEPLKALVENGFNVVGVITNPDKPAGRGQKISESAVKKYAQKAGLNILQPEKFRNPDFLKELEELNADLQIVVAFKMLPEVVWSMPKYGTLNLHASLLPQYRGAAPINWAIINGEKETGVSTFLLQHEIDTGDVLFSEKIAIAETDNVEVIYTKLMNIGANLVVKTANAIRLNEFDTVSQKELIANDIELKAAPKIFKEDCKVNWTQPMQTIYNLIRGLSPYPAAWSELINKETGKVLSFKVFETQKIQQEHNLTIGDIDTDKKTYIRIAVKEGFIQINDLQLSGKKRMKVADLLRGFQQINEFKINL